LHRKPEPIDGDDRERLESRISELEIANSGSCTVRERSPARFEVREGLDAVAFDHRLAIEFRDHRSASHAGVGKRVTARRQIETLHSDGVVPGLLVGERVEDSASGLQVAVGSDRVQILHRYGCTERLPCALHLYCDLPADAIVEQRLQGRERRQRDLFHSKKDVTDLELSVCGSAGDHLIYDEHAGRVGE